MIIDLAWIFGTFVLAYALGSIPFGLLITKAAGLGDIRKVGSGNIGATNVMRTGHKGLAALTLFLDAAKGYVAVNLAHYIYASDFAAMAGLFVVLGHIFPVWLRFKGGKGVATAFGVMAALNPVLTLASAVLWLMAFCLCRISSLASMLSIGYSPIIAYLMSDDISALVCLNLGALIVFTHRSNIARLLIGSEHSFTGKSS